jgi:hypothetical protein
MDGIDAIKYILINNIDGVAAGILNVYVLMN